MAGEILAGLGAFKTMFDLAKGLKNLNDSAARNSVAIELQEKILTAREQQAALAERVSELEKEVAAFETWETDKQRYELKPVGENDVLVYTLKEGVEPPESPHHICANCYADGKKSVLQPEERDTGRAHLLVCHRCKSEIYTFGTNPSGSRPRAGTFGRH
jgi:hypothetical protein